MTCGTNHSLTLILATLYIVSFVLSNALVHALYTQSGPVTLLNPRTFNEKIRNSKHPAVVEFFAPWCGHCKNLAPAYEKAAEHMAGIVTFAAVDCDDQTNRPLCQEFDIKGFPTIKFIKPYKGTVDAQDYYGPRTAKGLTDFAKENMENKVIRLTDDTLSSFLTNNNDSAKAIMFSTKGPTSPLWRSLAIEFEGRMTLAQVRDTQKKVVAEFNVDKFPTLVVLPGGSAEGIVYNGEMKPDLLLKFLAEYAPEETPEAAAPPVESKSQDTLDYTPKIITEVSDLIEKCLKKSGLCYLILDQDEMHSNIFAAVNKHFNTKQKLRIFATNILDKATLATDGSPSIVALNGGKGWFKRYDGDVVEKDIIAWIDSVKMGEGKKITIPDEVKQLLGSSESAAKEDAKTVMEEKVKLVFEEEPAKHDEL